MVAGYFEPAMQQPVPMYLAPHDAAEKVLYDHLVDENGNVTFPIDLTKVADDLGIKVYEADLRPNIAGLIVQADESEPVEIFLNKEDPQSRRRFTLAHELGHYVDRKSRGDDQLIGLVDYRDEVSSRWTDPQEVWANRFGAALLMPAFAVRNLWREGYTIVRMAKYFGVSKESMSYRLSALGLS